MIDFLISSDIKDSVLIDEDELSLIGKAKERKFLDSANEFYLNEAIELGVDESDIVVYDPNTDTEDLRDYNCKKVVELHFLKDAFFALWKKSEKDIYQAKYTETVKLFNNSVSKLTPNRIKGYKPAERKTSNSYGTITRYLGDGARSNKIDTTKYDDWDY